MPPTSEWAFVLEPDKRDARRAAWTWAGNGAWPAQLVNAGHEVHISNVPVYHYTQAPDDRERPQPRFQKVDHQGRDAGSLVDHQMWRATRFYHWSRCWALASARPAAYPSM